MPYSGDEAFKNAIAGNKKWCEATAAADPSFFPACAKGQAPKILWLGCCDSRVPETTVLGLKPGDVFVHRNIANIVNPTDTSMLSAVEFSVRYVGVETIVVCGHTGCGGIAATLDNQSLGVMDIWLHPLRLLREKYAEKLAKLETKEKNAELIRLNVQSSVDVVKRLPTVIEFMQKRGLTVHGCIYDLATGQVNEVDTAEKPEQSSERTDAFILTFKD